VFLGASFAFVQGSVQGLLLLAAFLNAFIALFNLIPMGILDGYKIFSWDKKLWALAFLPSLVLTIVAYVLVQPYFYAF
jgi:Zn-dependent protease